MKGKPHDKTMSRRNKKKHSSNSLKKSNEQQNESSGLLYTTAREYHYRYAEQIAYELEFHKHFSVLMPAKIGIHPFPINVYDGLDFRCREYIIVEKQEDVDLFNSILISKHNENNCIYPILYYDFLEKRPHGGCYVLFDLPQDKRMELSSILSSNKEVITISIGRLEDTGGNAKSSMVSQAQDVMNELYQITSQDGKPHCMIFRVDSILDIRDLMFAGQTEKTRLVSALNEICSDYELDYGLIDELTNASGNAEKMTLYRKMLSDREFEISLLKSVIASAGADMSELESGFKEISKMKQEFSEVYDRTADLSEQERLEAAFQNEVSELLVSITSKMLTLANRDKYEDEIVGYLGETVWKDRLSERSRKFLISALTTFDSIKKIKDCASLDYSGVCLQVTKVLDEEMAARFYALFKKYLSERYSISEWPQAMKNRYTSEPLSETDFTIGSLRYVIGISRNGRITDPSTYTIVQQFAKESLYNAELSDQDIHENLTRVVECAEKTRIDYRNPAAHRDSIPYISARECIDYLIEQTKMLRLILQNMKT